MKHISFMTQIPLSKSIDGPLMSCEDGVWNHSAMKLLHILNLEHVCNRKVEYNSTKTTTKEVSNK